MAIIKSVSGGAPSISAIIKYVTQEEKTNDKVLSIPIIDTYDDDEEENIYSLNEPFGEFEFKLRNSEDTVNVIEKKVKIFIDDIDDYIK